jgi:SAM-dependent methyltransferase
MRADAVQKLQSYIDDCNLPEEVKILEAGCGSFSYINIDRKTYIVGMDISDEQLDKNDKLDVKINADIQTYDFNSDEFDVIICWDVLEHLEHPKMAMENFVKASKNGGIIIIAVPNMQSLKGLVTKFTPHWFHVLFYKHILKKPHAGEAGNAPFPAFLKHEMSPSYLQKFAKEHNLTIAFMETYDALPRMVREQKRYLLFIYRTLSSILQALTFGKYGGRDNTDFVLVLQKSA